MTQGRVDSQAEMETGRVDLLPTKWNEMSRTIDFTVKNRRDLDRSINHPINANMDDGFQKFSFGDDFKNPLENASMDDGFQKFSFGGDFKIPMENSSYAELSSNVLDETGAVGAANSSSKIEQNVRKRKIDKDGFVTPATPDIPKSSTHYGESQLQDESSSYDVDSSLPKEEKNPAESSSSDESVPQPTEFQEVGQEAEMFLSDSVRLSGTGSTESAPSSVQDLMKGFGLELKFSQEQWAETFKESEDFELLFPNRLDDYLEGAKRLETLLSRQKDLLSHRLQGIGKTLQQE